MSKARLDTLLEKELDGTLTTLEQTELDRLLLLAPSARRERAGWGRIFQVLAQPGRPRRLQVEAMARAIVREARARGTAVPGPRPRQVVMAATLLVACFGLFALTGLVEPPSRQTRVAQLAGPVELELGLDAPDEEDVAPVTIHF